MTGATKSNFAWLHPAPGALVRKLDGTPIAQGGELLALSPYFTRLLNDGDVLRGKPLKKRKSA